jgi:hypothetical protein
VRSMNYVTELSNVLRDSNVNDDDKQAVLKSLRDLADKGDPEARNALDTGLRIPVLCRNLTGPAISAGLALRPKRGLSP